MPSYDREEVRARLERRAEELARTRRAVDQEGAGTQDAELSHVDQHPADQGTETHDQEVDATVEVFLDDEQQRIREALRAVEQGTYGICVDCGREIPEKRLEVQPEAVRCVEDQRRFEATHRQVSNPAGGRDPARGQP